MRTAVVILNWNGRKLLEQFLPSVINYCKNDAEVIVADNASTDDSVQYIQDHHPTVRIVQNEINGGFAKGYNDALKHIEADYYVLLNSDIEVTPNWIKPVIELMDKDKTIAACQPKILDFKQKDRFEYAGAAGGFIDIYGYPFCRGRIFDELERDNGQYNDNREVFWATGASMFVRAETFHQLGGFDEDFFAHMEEIDLCWRMKNEGYRVFSCGNSTVYHVGGGTLSHYNPRKTLLNYRNNLIMLYKNLPADRVFFIILIRLLLDALSGLRLIFIGRTNHFLQVIRAHWSFFSSLPRHSKKRKARYPKMLSGIYRRSIVFEYFYRDKKTFEKLDRDKFSA